MVMKTHLAPLAVLLLLSATAHAATQVYMQGPLGSGEFGHSVTVLPNGNFVVTDPNFDQISPPAADVGAVYLFTPEGAPISTLYGSNANDRVGFTGVRVLANGHFVVLSTKWNMDRGAVTWGSATTGFIGGGSVVVSAANSLVGNAANDIVGNAGVFPLTNGHYVVCSPNWDSTAPAVMNVGAVTWGSGVIGVTGPVSIVNSLVGTTANDNVGNLSVIALTNGNYMVHSYSWDNTAPAAIDAGAVSLGNGFTGTAGQVSSANSVLGTVAGAGFLAGGSYDPVRHQLIVGRRESNLVTRFIGDQLRSLAVTGLSAPGALDIAYAKPGIAAVNADGNALTDFTLSGSGANKGRNRALFAHAPASGSDLVLQSGTPVSILGGGLPNNAVATALHGQVFHQPNRGVFQATVKGTGISAANNRLLLLDNGIGVSLLHRTGQPIGVGSLANASVAAFTEVLQNHDEDRITLSYQLKTGPTVTQASDTGILLLNHSGVISINIGAREGEPAFGGGGIFGQFTGRAAAGRNDIIYFTALFKPAIGKAVPALFHMTADNMTKMRTTQAGNAAPGADGATFHAFTAVSNFGFQALVKATLKGSPANANEGLWRLPANVLLARKGDPIGGGLNIARLLRTGTAAPGVGPATVKAISAVEVNPVTGRYAILGTLSGSPANANQALWTGDPTLGDDSPALQILRLPQLTLRKGNAYSTAATPQSLIRSIALKPAADPTGAGGRGLAQALGASGDLALFITADRKLTEVVLLDR